MASSDSTQRKPPSRIDTSFSREFQDDQYAMLETDPPLSHRPPLPAFRLSLSPSAEVPSNPLPPQISNSNSRARSESRKLLSHVLTQLSNRRKPSPISQVISNAGRSGGDSGLDSLVESLKDAVRIKSLGQNPGSDRQSALQDGLERDADNIFSTDATFELMVQLKDVLIMSVSQGWRIFDER
jgi:hypothetical protein